MRNRLGQLEQVRPLIAPVDTGATALNAFVKLSHSHRCQLLVHFGVLTAATAADQPVVVTVLAATSAATTGATAIAFNYRISAATDTDTWGAVTAATSSGVSVNAATQDSMTLLIDIDPRALAAIGDDAIYANLRITPDAGAVATLVSAEALLEPRFAATTSEVTT